MAAAYGAASAAGVAMRIQQIAAAKFGGGAGGASSFSSSGQEVVNTQQQGGGTSQSIGITLVGDGFSRDQVVGLIGQINDAVDDGARLRVGG